MSSDELIWETLINRIPSYKRTNTGFNELKCPICRDYKTRCGIKRDANSVGINCFNCGFSTKYTVGNMLPKKILLFLNSIGCSTIEISRVKHNVYLDYRNFNSSDNDKDFIPYFIPSFKEISLPKNSFTFDEWLNKEIVSKDFFDTVDYSLTRGYHDIIDYRWSPSIPRRLIIPFYWNNIIVGYTSRSIDQGARYINNKPADYLYNNEVLSSDRNILFLVEGPLDAKAIDGVSALGSKLTANQITWLKSSGKEIIVVPDIDKDGYKMIDLAKSNRWKVAFPYLGNHNDWWGSSIKDVDEAVKVYGKLYTVKSLLESSTNNATEIEVKKKIFRRNNEVR